MINKKKLLFVNDEMEMGGVARVLNTLIANLDKNEFDIDLLVLHPHGMLLDEVPDNINIIKGSSFYRTIDCSLAQLLKSFDIPALFNKIRLIFYMKTGLIKKRIINERAQMLNKQYDVEIAAKEGFCTIFTAFGNSKKKINWVLTDYSVQNYSKRHMKLVKEALADIDLNIADSTQALEAYKQVFDVTNGISIHNLMDVNKVKIGMSKEEDKIKLSDDINVVTACRFHPQKAVDRLILAHKYAMDHGVENHLYLIGGGIDEDKLRKIVNDYSLTNVTFLGYRSNPYAVISECDLFVLSSVFEGFATVVNESLLANTPVLSTRVSGIEEQITQDNYGYICENNQVSLNESYLRMVSDKQKLLKMKELLKSYVYPNDKILEEFTEVLKS